MIIDANNLERPSHLRGDVVIVGGGTVGIFLAVLLAKNGKSVVVIESGGRVADTSGNASTAQSIGSRLHHGVLFGRASGLGGTSVLWGGQLAEFEEADLRHEGFSWPVSYRELRHWYDFVYDALGISKLSTRSYRTMFGGTAAEDHPGIERFFTVWLPQPNFAALFFKELTTNTRLRIVLNATANKLEFCGDRANVINAVTRDRQNIRVTATNFIFAAGTIANVRLFLSAQRLSDVPWKTNNLIGKYFQDHLGGKIADVDLLDQRRFRDFFENGFVKKIKLQPKLQFTKAVRERLPCGACGFFNFHSDIHENLANIKGLIRAVKSGIKFSKVRSLPSDLWRLNKAFGPLIARYLRHRRVLAFFDRGLEFHAQVEQIPTANSRIVICDSSPAWDGLYRASVEWQVDGREIETIQELAIQADTYLRQLGIAQLRIELPLSRGDLAFIDTLVDTSHQCGGMRMSATARTGVTDENCKVWGTENVYVSGASVFPTSSHANCTLTALALAARLAHSLGAER